MPIYAAGTHSRAAILYLDPRKNGSHGEWAAYEIGSDFLVHERTINLTVEHINGARFQIHLQNGDQCNAEISPQRGPYPEAIKVTCTGWSRRQLFELVSEPEKDRMIRSIIEEAKRQRLQ